MPLIIIFVLSLQISQLNQLIWFKVEFNQWYWQFKTVNKKKDLLSQNFARATYS